MPATRTLTPLPPGGVCHARSVRRDRLQRLMKELKEPFRVHRKQWEYALVVEALEAADLVGPGKRGLGFGVGVENRDVVAGSQQSGDHRKTHVAQPDEADPHGCVAAQGLSISANTSRAIRKLSTAAGIPA